VVVRQIEGLQLKVDPTPASEQIAAPVAM